MLSRGLDTLSSAAASLNAATDSLNVATDFAHSHTSVMSDDASDALQTPVKQNTWGGPRQGAGRKPKGQKKEEGCI